MQEILLSDIVSKILYSFVNATLSAAESRRLNGFQNRCLQTIWGISPTYVSRVSNAFMFEQAEQMPLSQALLQQQLRLFGKTA